MEPAIGSRPFLAYARVAPRWLILCSCIGISSLENCSCCRHIFLLSAPDNRNLHTMILGIFGLKRVYLGGIRLPCRVLISRWILWPRHRL